MMKSLENFAVSATASGTRLDNVGNNVEQEEEASTQTMEKALDEVGGHGPFQRRTVLALGTPCVSLYCLWVMQVFWGQIPEHECVNGTAVIIPCNQSTTTSCDFTMERTYVTEFNLLCDRAKIVPAFQASWQIGLIFGEFFWGSLTDRIGRRRTVLSSICALSFFIICSLISTTFTSYMPFLCFIVGAGFSGGGQGKLSLPLELHDAKRRSRLPAIFGLFWSFGGLVYLATSWYFRDWKISAAICFTPLFLGGVVMFIVLPESPRWLHKHGRVDEGIALLHNIAARNGKQLSIETEKEIRLMRHVVSEESPSVIGLLLKHKVLTARFVILVVIHFFHIILWFLVLFSTGDFGANPFLTYLFFLMMRGPVKFTVEVVGMTWMRRKGVMMCSFGTGGLLLLTAMMRKYGWVENNALVLTVLGVLCKGFSDCYWGYIYGCMYEQFPTVIRQRLAAVFDATGGVGAAVAPYVFGWPDSRIAISIICMLSSQLLWFLPSTLGKPLADTCEEAENLGRRTYAEVKQ